MCRKYLCARDVSFHLKIILKRIPTIAAQVPVIDAPARDPANVGKTQIPPLHSVVTKY